MWNRLSQTVILLMVSQLAFSQAQSLVTGHGSCPCEELELRVERLEDIVGGGGNHYNECRHIEVRHCEAMTIGSEYTTLDATGPGSWPAAGLCRVVELENSLSAQSYVYTVDLYNQNSIFGPNAGYPGVAFNVVDGNNFDIVFFRAAYTSGSRCLQYGYVSSGLFHSTTESPCPGAGITGQSWFKVKVEATGGRVTVYVNNVHINSVTTQFPSRSQTGIIVPNGYANIIFFRNASVRYQ